MSLTTGVTQLLDSDTNATALARADKLMYEEKALRKKTASKGRA